MKRRPFVGIAIAYAIGIAAGAFSLILTAVIAAFCVTSFALSRITKREQWGWAALLSVFGTVGGIAYHFRAQVDRNDVMHFAPRTIRVTGVVVSDVEGLQDFAQDLPRPTAKRPPRLRLTLEVDAAEVEPGRNDTVSGKVNVRLPVAQNENEIPHVGDRIRVRGRLELPDPARNPGAMDYRAFLARQGIFSLMNARRRDDWQIVQVSNSADPVTRLAFALRRRVLATPYHYLSPELAGTLNGIILGTHNDLPGRLRDDFQRTGTSHILAASGMNVAFVVLLSLWLFRSIQITFRFAPFLTICAVILYALMANSSPSIVRAAVMGIVVLFGMILEREPDYPSAIALSALLLLCYDPRNLFDIGFQLSFAAVITLTLFAPIILFAAQTVRGRIVGKTPAIRIARRCAEIFAASLVVTFVVQLGTAPLIAYYFSMFSLVGLFANGFVVPMIGFLMAAGFAAVALAAIHPVLAVLPYKVIGIILIVLIAIVQWFSVLLYSSTNVSPSAFGVCVWYAIFLYAAWMLHHKVSASPSQEEVQEW